MLLFSSCALILIYPFDDVTAKRDLDTTSRLDLFSHHFKAPWDLKVCPPIRFDAIFDDFYDDYLCFLSNLLTSFGETTRFLSRLRLWSLWFSSIPSLWLYNLLHTHEQKPRSIPQADSISLQILCFKTLQVVSSKLISYRPNSRKFSAHSALRPLYLESGHDPVLF
ncbi:hypothetical protein BDN72DRAFT_151967 [Pluteus cervinus]|uniref:Uncharacterized protein n=1 Tax=Pluteus cervinus TaxID=181527 RepID=A0ACD3B6N6_9AGAR|nr:hypothetical protein BDN72DRAFT_151967 [Pluteus cervinus]